MFWIIFGTASFTTLIVSWAMMLWFNYGSTKSRELIKKSGFCPECGLPTFVKPKASKKKQPLGFKV